MTLDMLMVELMATLQAAYNEVTSDHFHYSNFRREILDAHGYIQQMFEGGVDRAESENS